MKNQESESSNPTSQQKSQPSISRVQITAISVSDDPSTRSEPRQQSSCDPSSFSGAFEEVDKTISEEEMPQSVCTETPSLSDSGCPETLHAPAKKSYSESRRDSCLSSSTAGSDSASGKGSFSTCTDSSKALGYSAVFSDTCGIALKKAVGDIPHGSSSEEGFVSKKPPLSLGRETSLDDADDLPLDPPTDARKIKKKTAATDEKNYSVTLGEGSLTPESLQRALGDAMQEAPEELI